VKVSQNNVDDIHPDPARPVELWLGADVAKNNFVASRRLSNGEPATPATMRKMKTATFERSRAGALQLIEWGEAALPENARLCVLMEATGPYSVELAAWIKSWRPGLDVVVMRPKLIKEFASGIGARNKTDKLDAKAISVYGAMCRPAAPEPSEEKYHNLRALTRMRQSLIEQTTQLSNHTDTITSEALTPAIIKHLTRANTNAIKAIEKQIAQLDKLIKELIRADAELKQMVELLTSIKGVGWTTAATVLGELGDLRRFSTCRQLTSFAGLNPKLIDSGEKVGKARISKQGSPRARRVLYMATMSLLRSNAHYRKQHEELVARGKSKMTALIALMRKLLVLMRGVLKSQKVYDPNFKLLCGKANNAAQSTAA
jgi:transposase